MKTNTEEKKPKMKLYLLTHSESLGYDAYGSVVVVCESEEVARLMHPNGNHIQWIPALKGWYNTISLNAGRMGNVWVNPADVVVTQLSNSVVPKFSDQRYVVCASFHAG
jgi:hypothetical protein